MCDLDFRAFSDKHIKKIMKYIDPIDAFFLTLAMKTKVDGMWSEDEVFQQQNRVKVYRKWNRLNS